MCSGCGGCNGGNLNALYYLMTIPGIEDDATYTYNLYAGTAGTCAFNSAHVRIAVTDVITITGYQYEVLNIEDALAGYVQAIGPTSVSVCADDLQTYTTGTMTSCSSSPLNHALQIVGVSYPNPQGNGASGYGYWKLRNSWSSSFGVSGYVYVRYGSNLCGLASSPGYATVTSLVDVGAPTYAPVVPAALPPSITGYPSMTPTKRITLGTTENQCSKVGYYVLDDQSACKICPIGYYCPVKYFIQIRNCCKSHVTDRCAAIL